jgi:ABC-type Mn2+/Zn2+ transport system ATPase subunit
MNFALLDRRAVMVALTGPNGAGKITLAMTGLLQLELENICRPAPNISVRIIL